MRKNVSSPQNIIPNFERFRYCRLAERLQSIWKNRKDIRTKEHILHVPYFKNISIGRNMFFCSYVLKKAFGLLSHYAFCYPIMYFAGLPMRFTQCTINQEAANATIAAIGICKGIGTLRALINTTDGPVKK